MLKALYTYFDVEHNSIELSENANFLAEKLHLNNTPKNLFILLGIALALLAIAALLGILKKCPYDPNYKPKKSTDSNKEEEGDEPKVEFSLPATKYSAP